VTTCSPGPATPSASPGLLASTTKPGEPGRRCTPTFSSSEDGEHIVCDLLEPRTQSQSDTVAKAKGLATFAEKHGHKFGRVQLLDEVDGKLKRLDFKSAKTRKSVKALDNPEALRQLFADAEGMTLGHQQRRAPGVFEASTVGHDLGQRAAHVRALFDPRAVQDNRDNIAAL
jgi:hypothetical protein